MWPLIQEGDAATEAKEQGTFGFVETGIPTAKLSGYMA